MRAFKIALLLTALTALGGCRYGAYGSSYGFGYEASDHGYSVAYRSGYSGCYKGPGGYYGYGRPYRYARGYVGRPHRGHAHGYGRGGHRGYGGRPCR